MNEHDRIIESEFERRWSEGGRPLPSDDGVGGALSWGQPVSSEDVAEQAALEAHQAREEQRVLDLEAALDRHDRVCPVCTPIGQAVMRNPAPGIRMYLRLQVAGRNSWGRYALGAALRNATRGE